MRKRILISMAFIVMVFLISNTKATAVTRVRGLSGFDNLPLDLKTLSFDYLESKIALPHYMESYHKVNGTTREGMTQSIRQRLFDDKLSLNEWMALNVFFKNNHQRLDDSTKRLQLDLIHETPLKLKHEIAMNMKLYIIVNSPWANTLSIRFSPFLKRILEALPDLNININGIISLKQIISNASMNASEIYRIHLSKNEIQSLDIFLDLNQFQRLESLWLNNNKLSNIDALHGLTALETLHLSSNQISNIDVLRSLKGLEYLYLHSTQISNIDALRQLKGLRQLYLYSNQISDIDALRQSFDNLDEQSHVTFYVWCTFDEQRYLVFEPHISFLI